MVSAGAIVNVRIITLSLSSGPATLITGITMPLPAICINWQGTPTNKH